MHGSRQGAPNDEETSRGDANGPELSAIADLPQLPAAPVDVCTFQMNLGPDKNIDKRKFTAQEQRQNDLRQVFVPNQASHVVAALRRWFPEEVAEAHPELATANVGNDPFRTMLRREMIRHKISNPPQGSTVTLPDLMAINNGVLGETNANSTATSPSKKRKRRDSPELKLSCELVPMELNNQALRMSVLNNVREMSESTQCFAVVAFAPPTYRPPEVPEGTTVQLWQEQRDKEDCTAVFLDICDYLARSESSGLSGSIHPT